MLDSESMVTSTRRMRIILDAKLKKSDLNKVMTEQCQHLEPEERYILIDLFSNF